MEDDTYRFGEFSMSPRERRLFRNGKSVLLPPKAFDAMYLLVRSHGNLISRAEVFSALWPGVCFAPTKVDIRWSRLGH